MHSVDPQVLGAKIIAIDNKSIHFSTHGAKVFEVKTMDGSLRYEHSNIFFYKGNSGEYYFQFFLLHKHCRK